MPRGVPRNYEQRRESRAREAAALGERIRFYRLLRRKTMQELADESGCSLHTIWRTESGRNQPRYKTQERIADALEVDLEALDAGPLPQAPEELAGWNEESEIPYADEPSEVDMEEVRRVFGEFGMSWGDEPGGLDSDYKPSRKDRRKKQRAASNGQARGRKSKKKRR